MHKEVQTYCESIKDKFPDSFKNKKVLDVWSLDINGNNRYLFENCDYTWIDLWEWKNVDYVCNITRENELEHLWKFDTIISTEMLEHCEYYWVWLLNMYNLLNSWWLLLITAAWEWRPEHWTTRTSPKDAPFTNDWYKNIVERDFEWILNDFSEYEISKEWTDIRFYGIKK